MSESTHSGPSSTTVFIALVVALFVSIGISEVSTSGAAVASIYIIAVGKAFLVVNYFINLRMEPAFVKSIIIGTLITLSILFIGLIPDIVAVFGESPL